MAQKVFPKIKCPYCFKEFNHDEVHFRISQQSAQAAQKLMEKASEQEKKYYANYLKMKQIDAKYNVVWGDIKGGKAPSHLMQLFYLPYVSKANLDKNTILMDSKTGFVYGIQDGLPEAHFISETRICPHCHNYLPGRYGQHEQIFISILGVSSSGKTVFIKQLVRKLKEVDGIGILSHIDASLEAFIPPETKLLNNYEQLPAATESINFKVPYFLTITFKNNETRDIVIYDIAGENLIVRDGNPNAINRFNFFGGFIKHSNAIISLIDPNQVFTNQMDKSPWTAKEMISTLIKTVGNNKINIPTAFTISKSDLLLNHPSVSAALQENNISLNNIIFNDISWDSNKRYFYNDEYLKVFNMVRNRILKQFIPGFVTSADNSFESHAVGYFAVSSLSDGVEYRLCIDLSTEHEAWTDDQLELIKEKLPVLSKEIEKIQYFSKLEPVHKNTIEADFVISSCNTNIRKLDRLLAMNFSTRYEMMTYLEDVYALDDVIELKNSKNEIYALSIRELIEYLLIRNNPLSFMKLEMNLIGYPSRNGNLASTRLEEPLFWIFSKLGLNEAKRKEEPVQVKKQSFMQRLFKKGGASHG